MTFAQAKDSAHIVLIEFYASWCPHCQHMMPIVAQVKELLEGRVPVFQFDIDRNPQDASDADVQSIPTFLVFNDGREVWRHSGEMDGQDLLNAVQSYL